MEHVTNQFRLLTLVTLSWMEAPWLPTVLNMLEDIPYKCPIIHGYFGRLSAQGSAIAAFTI